jgi:hypothetical protein
MTDGDNLLVREATVDITRRGDIVSIVLQGEEYQMEASEAEKIGTELLAIGRHGEDHESVPDW